MNNITLFVVAFLVCIAVNAQSKAEKINLSYWYVFGRFPSTGEMNFWNGQAEQSLNSYITTHHNFLKADNNSAVEAVRISYKDAFGRSPAQGEINFWSKQKRTYGDLMNNHVLYLLSDGNENRATINRAYQTVLGRQASTDELNQWSRGNCSYAVLLACLQSYKTSPTYRLLSADAVFNFVKNAWETSANFVVNTGRAVYNAAASAVTATVAAAQRVLALVVTRSTANELRTVDPKTVIVTENGLSVIAGGAGNMKGLPSLINLDGGTIVGTNSGTLKEQQGVTLIAAGGLN
jgi:hypothetical protein